MSQPKTVHYRVLLNETQGSRFIALEQGSYLRLAYAAQLEVEPSVNDLAVLDRIYRLLNVEHPRNYLNRSLSVADVVTIFRRAEDCSYFEPRSYVVQLAGFFELDVVVLTDCLYGGRAIEPLEIILGSVQTDAVDKD